MGVIANLLYGAFSGNDVVWGSPAKYAFYYLLLYVFGMATGFAFGALLLNSAGRASSSTSSTRSCCRPCSRSARP